MSDEQVQKEEVATEQVATVVEENASSQAEVAESTEGSVASE